MKTSSQGFRNLDYAIHSVMADNMEPSSVNYQRYLKWAIDCYNDLSLYRFPSIKTVELTVKDNFTVDLPEDYVDFVAIGVYLSGRLWTLTRNDRLERKPIEDCNVPIESATQDLNGQFAGITPYGYIFGGSFRNGQYVGEQFAYGGGWNHQGYYHVDIANRRIEFSNVIRGKKLILEYIGNGISCDGTAEIPFASVPVFTSYIHWMSAEHDRTVGDGQKERKRQLYYIEYNKYAHQTLMFTMDEFLDYKYRTVKMTPKR